MIEIRGAFLRFFVALFRNYEKFLPASLGEEFRRDEFVHDLGLDGNARVYISEVVSTQMFERFVEERVSDPDQAEVLFFDESIVAKNNRSKLKTVKGKGRKTTPFLSDQSGAVTETYMPPLPSNWGLPDDGRTYHYVSFPRLDLSLFGKIRPPKQWDQISRKGRRMASAAFLSQQQAILSKALSHGGGADQGTIPTGREGRPEKNVEWAIHALAYREFKPVSDGSSEDHSGRKTRAFLKRGKENHSPASPLVPLTASASEGAMRDISKAHGLILSARRDRGITLTAIVRLQSLYRMHVASYRFKMLRRAAIALQRQHRKNPAIREVIMSKYERIVLCAILIQRIFRGYSARVFRRLHLESTRCIQTWWRCHVARRKFVQLRVVAVMAQAMFRGRRVRFVFRLILRIVSKAQGIARGWIIRRHILKLRRARAKRYRVQMFNLWRRTRTPLAYRSRFWRIVNGSGFLHLSILEDELERLWYALAVDFPTVMKEFRDTRITNPIKDIYCADVNVYTHNRYLLVSYENDWGVGGDSRKVLMLSATFSAFVIDLPNVTKN